MALQKSPLNKHMLLILISVLAHLTPLAALVTHHKVEAKLEEASTGGKWAPRQRIPGSHDEAETPYLVGGDDGEVHAFYSQPVPANSSAWAIVYSKWTFESGWTAPSDIILPPMGMYALVKGAHLDGSGMVHLVIFGGDDFNANIYHSSAPVAYAGQARAWSQPKLVGRAAEVRMAALAGDRADNLFAVYSGSPGGGRGLYAVISGDGGATWSEPDPVFLTNDISMFPYGVQVSVTAGQPVHVTWSVNNLSGVGQSIMYAQYEPTRAQWSTPVELAKAGEPDARLEDRVIFRLSWPAVIQQGNQLIAIYIACEPCERRMRLSTDSGRTWSPAVQPMPPTRGEYGAVQFIEDITGNLHMFLGDRARGLNMWHSVWDGVQWQTPESVAPATEAARYLDGPLTFHPQRPNAAKTDHALLVAWQTDRGHTHNGTWYSYQLTSAQDAVPSLPRQDQQSVLNPLPVSSLQPTSAAFTDEASSEFRSPQLTTAAFTENMTEQTLSTAETLFLALTPVFLLVLVFVGVHSFNRRRSR
jgi:hypothetical protein